MTKTQLLDRFSRTGEDRILLARILDQEETARLRGLPACTVFLSPAEQALCQDLLAAAGTTYFFTGGYPGAERRICVFLPDWMSPESFREEENCPLCALTAETTGGNGLTHRDFLGSLMGLGLTREKLGDLLVEEGRRAQVLCLREALPILETQWDKAGKYPLRLTPLPLDKIHAPQVETRHIRDTVASLRLDAVLASGFSLSRGKAADWIASGRVTVNHRPCEKADKLVTEGDVLVCRGLGKCVLSRVDGLSKKGRIMIHLNRY